MKRGQWSGVATGVMALFGTAAVTWFVSVKPADLPVWPAVVFTVITAAAFYGMVAPLRNWPPFKPEPVEAPKEHREQLRNIASELHDQISREGYPRYSKNDRDPEILETMFKAHFPHIHALIATLSDQSSQWKTARRQYLQDAGRQMLERFREDDGWDLDELKRRFRAHQWGIAEGTRGLELEEDDKRKALTWDGKVVFTPRLKLSPELMFALTSASISVEDWLDGAGQSEEAKAMRSIRSEFKKTEAAAVAALEPVISHQPIFAAEGCEICNPRQRAG